MSPRKNHRKWEKFNSELERIRSDLDSYVYDPFSLPKNDTYNLEKSKAHGFKEFDYNTKLILLPTSSVEH